MVRAVYSWLLNIKYNKLIKKQLSVISRAMLKERWLRFMFLELFKNQNKCPYTRYNNTQLELEYSLNLYGKGSEFVLLNVVITTIKCLKETQIIL